MPENAEPNTVPGGRRVSSALQTGVSLATRGRRDMSSRVKDVVLGLGLCHNVSSLFL